MTNKNMMSSTWIRGPEYTPITEYRPLESEVKLLQSLLDQQTKEIDLLRKMQHKGVIIEAARALRCPCCNAPIQFDSRPYILETKNIRKRCEYCGNLLEFLTKE